MKRLSRQCATREEILAFAMELTSFDASTRSKELRARVLITIAQKPAIFPQRRSQRSETPIIPQNNQPAMATPTRPTKRTFRPTSNQSPNPLQAPILPATIQTSLLNVGMRVRKSVPEGYKTRPKSPTNTNGYGPFRVEGNLHRSYSSTGLLPYCGTLKVGNLEQEQTPSFDDLPPLISYDDDDGGFPSSQESTFSEASSGNRYAALPLLVNSNKRLYDEQEQLSPLHPDPLRSSPLFDTDTSRIMALRPMLQPKTRKAPPMDDRVVKIRQGEDMDVDDFGEAEFLENGSDLEDEL